MAAVPVLEIEQVLENLRPIFPQLTDQVIRFSVLHPSNRQPPNDVQTVLQRCIDDLLDLRTFKMMEEGENQHTVLDDGEDFGEQFGDLSALPLEAFIPSASPIKSDDGNSRKQETTPIVIDSPQILQPDIIEIGTPNTPSIVDLDITDGKNANVITIDSPHPDGILDFKDNSIDVELFRSSLPEADDVDFDDFPMSPEIRLCGTPPSEDELPPMNTFISPDPKKKALSPDFVPLERVLPLPHSRNCDNDNLCTFDNRKALSHSEHSMKNAVPSTSMNKSSPPTAFNVQNSCKGKVSPCTALAPGSKPSLLSTHATTSGHTECASTLILHKSGHASSTVSKMTPAAQSNALNSTATTSNSIGSTVPSSSTMSQLTSVAEKLSSASLNTVQVETMGSSSQCQSAANTLLAAPVLANRSIPEPAKNEMSVTAAQVPTSTHTQIAPTVTRIVTVTSNVMSAVSITPTLTAARMTAPSTITSKPLPAEPLVINAAISHDGTRAKTTQSITTAARKITATDDTLAQLLAQVTAAVDRVGHFKSVTETTAPKRMPPAPLPVTVTENLAAAGTLAKTTQSITTATEQITPTATNAAFSIAQIAADKVSPSKIVAFKTPSETTAPKRMPPVPLPVTVTENLTAAGTSTNATDLPNILSPAFKKAAKLVAAAATATAANATAATATVVTQEVKYISPAKREPQRLAAPPPIGGNQGDVQYPHQQGYDYYNRYGGNQYALDQRNMYHNYQGNQGHNMGPQAQLFAQEPYNYNYEQNNRQPQGQANFHQQQQYQHVPNFNFQQQMQHQHGVPNYTFAANNAMAEVGERHRPKKKKKNRKRNYSPPPVQPPRNYAPPVPPARPAPPVPPPQVQLPAQPPVVNVAQQPPQPAGPSAAEIDEAATQVLTMLPDADENFVKDKLRMSLHADRVLFVCNWLLENPYPKQQKPPPPTPAATASVTSSEVIDYTTRYKSFAYSSDYRNQCLVLLQSDFTRISINDLRMVANAFRGGYYPTKKHILDTLSAANINIHDVNRTPPSQRNKENRETNASSPKIDLKTVEISLPSHSGRLSDRKYTMKLLKCGRHRPTVPVTDSELHAELEWIKETRKAEAEDENRNVAAMFNEEEYAATGQLIECGCCYCDYAFEGMVQCYEGHLFCRDCLKRYAEESVFGQGKADLMCMSDGCEATFPMSQLKVALPSKILARYEDRCQEEALNLADIPDLVRCPHCDFAAILDPNDKVFKCHSCYKETCRHCKEDWAEHFGIPCSEMEKKDEVSLRIAFEEKMTQARIRTCFKCKSGFTKIDGCNKMTCRCGAKMCYICRAPNIDYNHFCRHARDPGKSCTHCKACSLWSNPEEDEQRAIQEIRKEANEARRAQGFEEDKLIGAPDEPQTKKAKK